MPHFLKKLTIAAVLTCTLFTAAFAADMPDPPQTLSDFEAVWDYVVDNNAEQLEFHYDEKQSVNVYQKYKNMIELMTKEYHCLYPEKFNYLSLKDCSFIEDEGKRDGFTMILKFGDKSEQAKRSYYEISLEKAEELYHTAIDKISLNLSQRERAKILCNAVMSKVSYINDATALCHTAYSALINGYAVCDGYTSLLNMLLRMDGIECEGRHGTAGGGLHEWTYAKLDGEWVNIDVTWADGGRYEYMAMTDEEIAKTHTANLSYVKLREKETLKNNDEGKTSIPELSIERQYYSNS